VGLVDNGTGVMTFIYKAINAWGDGIYAKEFYDTARKSQIDNGFIESDESITDEKILSYFGITMQEPILEENLPSEEGVATATFTRTAMREYAPENITSLKPNEVFVFGSNTEGRHGAGAAKTAVDKFGAKYGQAEGLQGQSYAIVTKDLAKGERSISLRDLSDNINDFLVDAIDNPNLKFYVTKIGTGLAGYKVSEIRNIFNDFLELDMIPDNVILPREYEVRDVVAAPDYDSITDITPERKQQILTNFAKKHKLTEAKAKEYINDALKKDAKKVINKLKECY